MYIILYFGTLISLLAIDSVWLFSTSGLYKNLLSSSFDVSLSIPPAIIFYLIYTFGVVMFVLIPAIQKSSGWVSVLLTGALFGIVSYAVYDLTNQATIRNWPIAITFMDMTWGAILTGVCSCLVYVLYMHFK